MPATFMIRGTMRTNLPRSVRFLRRRSHLRQSDLGERARVSRDVVSRAERGDLRGMTLASIDRIAEALGASIDLTLRWHGEQLDRLTDAAHARLQDIVATRLRESGWRVEVEVSFNHYGDRGRVDVAAWDPSTRLLLIVEVKSSIGDLQETVGRLDVKARLAAIIAQNAGWSRPAAAVPVLAILPSRTTRRIISNHAALFARFTMRGRRATSWLRRRDAPAPSGVLLVVNWPDSYGVPIRRGQRVRLGQSSG